MMEIETELPAVREALERHLGVKGRSLAQQVKRAGRRLPRRIRAQAVLLAEAEALSGNPRLLRQLDKSRIAEALSGVSAYLAGIDRTDARHGRILSILAVLAFNFILIFIVFVIFLRMREII